MNEHDFVVELGWRSDALGDAGSLLWMNDKQGIRIAEVVRKEGQTDFSIRTLDENGQTNEIVLCFSMKQDGSSEIFNCSGTKGIFKEQAQEEFTISAKSMGRATFTSFGLLQMPRKSRRP